MSETAYTIPLVILGVIAAVVLFALKIACYRRSVLSRCCHKKRETVTTGTGRPVIIYPQEGRDGRTRSGSVLYVPYKPPRQNNNGHQHRRQNNNHHRHPPSTQVPADIRRPITDNIATNSTQVILTPSAPPLDPPNYDQVVDSSPPSYSSVVN